MDTLSLPWQPTRQGPVIGYTIRQSRYLNITSRCTLRCTFCPKFNGNWTVQSYNLRLRGDPPTATEILAAAEHCEGCHEVVFCGLGEPTLRLNTVLHVAEKLKRRGYRIRLNTDGLANRIHHRDVTPEMAGRIDALSVSLNAQDEDTYNRYCRPRVSSAYTAVLDFVCRARNNVPDITLTAIDGLPGVNIDRCRAIAAELGVRFRRRVIDRVG